MRGHLRGLACHFRPIPRADQRELLSLLDVLRDDGRDEWLLPSTPFLLDLIAAYQDRLKAFIVHAGPEWGYVDRELEHVALALK